jgi:hypothetical protein
VADVKTISSKIVKLLNLAKSTTSQHEAEAALAKAKELLNAHNLNEGEASIYAEGIIEKFYPYGWKQRPRWIPSLIDTIGYHFNVRSYVNERLASWFTRYRGYSAFLDATHEGTMSDKDWDLLGFVFIGLEVDVVVAGHAYDYARQTINRMANQYARQFPKKRRYVARMSYADGLVQGLSDALYKQGRGAGAVAVDGEEDVPTRGAQLVKIDEIATVKFDLIDAYMDKNLDLLGCCDFDHAIDMEAMERGENDGLKIELVKGLDASKKARTLEIL